MRSLIETRLSLEQQVYWQKQLTGLSELHNLPTCVPQKKRSGFACWQSELRPAVLTALEHRATEQGICFGVVMQAIFGILLSRWQNSLEVAFGTPSSCHRMLQDSTERYLIIRSNFSEGTSFQESVHQTKEVVSTASAHGGLTLGEISLLLNSSENSEPPFRFLLTEESFRDDGKHRPNFDVVLNFSRCRRGLVFSLTYNLQLFEPDWIENFGQGLRRIIGGAATDPQANIFKLPMLSAEEMHFLTNGVRDTHEALPQYLLHEMFEQRVMLAPQSTAIKYRSAKLTYSDLNSRANVLSRHLRFLGVGVSTRVGILMTACPDMIVGIFAILKSGGSYVPLDPAYPTSRLVFMIKDCGLQHLLVTSHLSVPTVISDEFEGRVVDMSALDQQEQNENEVCLNPSRGEELEPVSEAYVIYTSGSTGKPKGVRCTHRSVVNLVCSIEKAAPVTSQGNSILWTSTSFDVSVYEIFGALTMGASLHIISKAIRTAPELLFNFLADERITSGYLPTAYLSDFASWLETHCTSLQLERLLVGVEPIQEELLLRIQKSVGGLQIVNGYGPTEATVCCSLYKVGTCAVLPPSNYSPIGFPIGNTNLYVLGAAKSLCPFGVIGELYIGGEGVALGYLNRPKLTKERFVESPYVSTSGNLLYRTGDLVRYLKDGSLEFIGRVDNQIKLRGFRIELGEIEYELSKNSLVASSIVTVEEDRYGVKVLVAYVMSSLQEDILGCRLRKYLSSCLPQHMVPSEIRLVRKWPLTPNGKVDKVALSVSRSSVNPQKYSHTIDTHSWSEKQLGLLTIFKSLLGERQFTLTDRFSECGGHSLLRYKLIISIKREFGVLLTPEVVRDASIRDLSLVLG